MDEAQSFKVVSMLFSHISALGWQLSSDTRQKVVTAFKPCGGVLHESLLLSTTTIT